MIKLADVGKTYEGVAGSVRALSEVNLEIDAGNHVAIVGKSGSGKSTLLNLIAGIDRPSSGTLIVNGQDLNLLSENELSLWRGRSVGIVFQFYQLLPTLSAIDNVLFPMDLVNKIPKRDRVEMATRYLEEVGLAGKAKKFPNELSGGERQRVAIARAMSNRPALIIADEPTGNLDSKTGEQIYELFQKLNDHGTTLITVTHASVNDRDFHRVFHIDDGYLTEVDKVTGIAV